MRAIAGILFAFLVLPVAWAALIGENAHLSGSAFIDGSLEAELLSSGPISFSSSPETVALQFHVENRAAAPITVYLAAYENGGWTVLERLGTIDSGASQTFSYRASFEYPGAANDSSRIALISEIPGGIGGRSFSITENWAEYEDALFANVSNTGVVLVPVVLFLIALIGFLALREAARGSPASEYTMRSLFLPDVHGRPIAEVIADLLINPLFWLFELACGALLVGLILYSSLLALSFKIAILAFVIGGIACWLMPFAYVIALWYMPVWKREPLRFPASLFMWGILAAFISFWVNSLAELSGRSIVEWALGPLGVTLFSIASAIIIAPVVEELAKGFGVFIASGHHEMHDMFDGILYGFAVGAGFAAIENWFYFAVENNPASAGSLENWLFLMVYRSVFNSIGHGWFTACTGAAIGYMKSHPTFRVSPMLGVFPGLAAAIGLHALFNLFAVADGMLRVSTSLPIFIFNPFSVIIMTLVFFALILFALRERNKKRRTQEARAQAGTKSPKKTAPRR